ncbi:MAG TPA: DinB family protein [Gammaproteobacteria bacterium]|nr:DinB family protein [Gammaproteobacteria bacterium]
MLPKDYFITMARYNRWMNERIYACCAELSDAARKKDRGAFFESIHGTLNHIVLGDLLWLGRFKGEPFTDFSGLDDELYPDFGDLQAARRRIDAEILEFIDALDEARIAGELRYTTVVNPAPRVSPFWLALMHFFNHQTHHRGQVTTLLSQAGIDPGVTDLMWLPDVPFGLKQA